ncbi:MAG: hypothetical protein C4542_04110 [Dehalococcoidia bacterium]|nr:MAG: hypothetical protein C4542_04110 [Dehalococcoidia bacterium]
MLNTGAFSSEQLRDVAVSPKYAQDKTIFVLTFANSGGALFNVWRTQDGALTWQKVFAASGSVQLDYVGLSPDYGRSARVVYLLGSTESGPALWYSADAGSTWSVRPAPEGTGAPNPFIVASDSGLFLSEFDGINQAFVRYSANGGASFNAGVSAGSLPVCSMALSPGYAQDRTLLIGNTDGGVLWSSDGGGSFQTVSATPLTGMMRVEFDENFAASRIVYAVSDSSGGGIYSASVGAGQPWQRLDPASPSDETLGGLAVSSTGVLYASSFRPVNAASSRGGLLRCLSPVSPASFERVTVGLSDGAVLSEGVLECVGNQLWAVDSAGNRLMTFVDTLSQPVRLSFPAHNASDVGNISSGRVSGVSLSWQPLEGATLYQWQLSAQSDFSIIADGFAASSAGTGVTAPSLALASTYYWRVRGITPLYSPWSDTWSFVTASLGVPQLVSPLAWGAALKPLFQWNPVSKATGYELVVSRKSDFTNPVVSKTGTHSLTNSYWQSDVALDNSTVYYWRVRALASSLAGEWSAAGAFLTQAATVPTTTVVPSSTTPNTSPATTTALPVSTPPPSILTTPVTSTVPAVTVTVTILPVLPPSPVPTVIVPASTTAAQSPVTVVPPPTAGAPLIVPQIPGETPDWVYYVLAGGSAGVVLLSAIILLARSRKKPLL